MNTFTPDESITRIVCAAEKCNRSGYIAIGARHNDEIMRQNWKLSTYHKVIPQSDEITEGFIDQFCRFHNRKEAHKIAMRQGQIINRCGGDEETLYSENLY
jgi:hypothetical protein